MAYTRCVVGIYRGDGNGFIIQVVVYRGGGPVVGVER